MSDKNNVNMVNFRRLIDTKSSRAIIAEALGCDVSMVTKHYNGDRKITVDYLVKYANYFNVSTDYLLGLAKESTTDKDLSYICNYTGLSEDSVCALAVIELGISEGTIKGREFRNWDDTDRNFHNLFISQCLPDLVYLIDKCESHLLDAISVQERFFNVLKTIKEVNDYGTIYEATENIELSSIIDQKDLCLLRIYNSIKSVLDEHFKNLNDRYSAISVANNVLSDKIYHNRWEIAHGADPQRQAEQLQDFLRSIKGFEKEWGLGK